MPFKKKVLLSIILVLMLVVVVFNIFLGIESVWLRILRLIIVILCGVFFLKDFTKEKVFKNVIAKSLRDLVVLIGQCNMIIGNDGGAMNMAKALNKPTFIIFSPWIEKKAWNTFEDGKNHISVHLNDYLPEEFANKKLKTIKKFTRF